MIQSLLVLAMLATLPQSAGAAPGPLECGEAASLSVTDSNSAHHVLATTAEAETSECEEAEDGTAAGVNFTARDLSTSPEREALTASGAALRGPPLSPVLGLSPSRGPPAH